MDDDKDPAAGYQHGGSDVNDRKLDPHAVMYDWWKHSQATITYIVTTYIVHTTHVPRLHMYSQLVVAFSIYHAEKSQLVRSASHTVFNRS
jgi:hypothetical protein